MLPALSFRYFSYAQIQYSERLCLAKKRSKHSGVALILLVSV